MEAMMSSTSHVGDEDEGHCGTVPCDTLVAIQFLLSQFVLAKAKGVPADICPFALLSQIYASVPDRTAVDRELQVLQSSGTVRVLQLPTLLKDKAAVLTADYVAQVQAAEASLAAQDQDPLSWNIPQRPAVSQWTENFRRTQEEWRESILDDAARSASQENDGSHKSGHAESLGEGRTEMAWPTRKPVGDQAEISAKEEQPPYTSLIMESSREANASGKSKEGLGECASFSRERESTSHEKLQESVAKLAPRNDEGTGFLTSAQPSLRQRKVVVRKRVEDSTRDPKTSNHRVSQPSALLAKQLETQSFMRPSHPVGTGKATVTVRKLLSGKRPREPDIAGPRGKRGCALNSPVGPECFLTKRERQAILVAAGKPGKRQGNVEGAVVKQLVRVLGEDLSGNRSESGPSLKEETAAGGDGGEYDTKASWQMSVLRSFREVVLKRILEPCVTRDELLKHLSPAAEQDVTFLMEAGFIIRRDDATESFWLSIPGVGPALKHLAQGRKELLRIFRKTKYKEISEAALQDRALTFSAFGAKFLARDFLGMGWLQRLQMPCGPVLRLVYMGSGA